MAVCASMAPLIQEFDASHPAVNARIETLCPCPDSICSMRALSRENPKTAAGSGSSVAAIFTAIARMLRSSFLQVMHSMRCCSTLVCSIGSRVPVTNQGNSSAVSMCRGSSERNSCMLSSSVCPQRKHPTQLATRVKHPCLHGAHRTIDDLGDFLVGMAVDVSQFYHRTLFRGKQFKQLLQLQK